MDKAHVSGGHLGAMARVTVRTRVKMRSTVTRGHVILTRTNVPSLVSALTRIRFVMAGLIVAKMTGLETFILFNSIHRVIEIL